MGRRCRHPHDHIDVLVNNVGHYLRSVPFRQSDPEHWDELHDINLRQLFLVTRNVLVVALHRRNSSIINVHSVEALRGTRPTPCMRPTSGRGALHHIAGG